MLTKLKSKTLDWTEGQRKKMGEKGRDFKVITMCEKCYTFYYKNSWHFEKPEEVLASEDYTVPVHFTQCPACLEQEIAYDMELGSMA